MKRPCICRRIHCYRARNGWLVIYPGRRSLFGGHCVPRHLWFPNGAAALAWINTFHPPELT